METTDKVIIVLVAIIAVFGFFFYGNENITGNSIDSENCYEEVFDDVTGELVKKRPRFSKRTSTSSSQKISSDIKSLRNEIKSLKKTITELDTYVRENIGNCDCSTDSVPEEPDDVPTDETMDSGNPFPGFEY